MAISLEKGGRVSLTKENAGLTEICVGINWGAIVSRGFFGGKKVEAVDLDASIGVYDDRHTLLETIYYGNLRSSTGAIKHSGDDLVGDTDGDDGADNETIHVDLSNLSPSVTTLAVVLNSFQGHDFKDIPYAGIRVYEGKPQVSIDNDKCLCYYDIANDDTFAGKVSMVLGKITKKGDEWEFQAIGESTRDTRLNETLDTFKRNYL